ncbi:potassium channel subfamily K member 1-like [Protopterus annectens]|uniref:potassium channel subfamily K member 1-like n=1 Tax=Protopterus annectens TaxID=7888 RepID=UPI001CFAEEF4|nr:potassium channel subfamily K member 1-like [Protopterus annectens]
MAAGTDFLLRQCSGDVEYKMTSYSKYRGREEKSQISQKWKLLGLMMSAIAGWRTAKLPHYRDQSAVLDTGAYGPCTKEDGYCQSYGHTVPLSDGGKAFCIIYSLIGIPFTLLFLSAIVQRIMVYITRRPIIYIHTRWGFSKQTIAIVHAVGLGIIVVTCFFFIPAAIFSVLEGNWNFLESFYFCFISLSTIGLGDYVPGEGYNQKFRELYKIGITCYLMLGLIAMLLVLETFCELQQLKKFRKMFYVKKSKGDDQLCIMEHDQLSFSSISDQAAVLKEDQKLNEPFMSVPPVTYYATDGSING